jgi:hypothetical protein
MPRLHSPISPNIQFHVTVRECTLPKAMHQSKSELRNVYIYTLSRRAVSLPLATSEQDVHGYHIHLFSL